MQWKFIPADYFDGLKIGRVREHDDKVDHVVEIKFETREAGETVPGATPIRGVDVRSFLQGAMDAAYAMGLRPSQGNDEKDMKRHLDDMRAIAFHTLKMDRKA